MPKEINAGYEIVRRQRVGAVEIVLAHNPKAPEQYVTWKCRNGGEYNHGHYFVDEGRAVMDFSKRIHNERMYER